VSNIIGILVLVLVYYRGFGFLRIFDTFTTLVGMINKIISELIVFFAVLFYAYFTIVVLMLKLDSTDNFNLRFQDVYYWVFLGGVEGDAFDIKFSHIPVIYGTLIITIVLLNILIAYLSNLFSRLEDQQRVNGLKERAFLILDFELMVRLFKYIVTGVISLEKKKDEYQSRQIMLSKQLNLSEV
jgi:hypothetical protein